MNTIRIIGTFLAFAFMTAGACGLLVTLAAAVGAI